ncbi:MAG: rhodanese-like domain-containing protein [Planctomycetota bacterium]|nr:MAG: rhodanese-like domain-containing protein [Planctomycetota bacterium]
MSRHLLQAFLFLLAGAALGVAGNALHPGGIQLGRTDYFLPAAGGGDAEEGDDLLARIPRIGLEEARALWQESWDADQNRWREEIGIYFLDARRAESYAAGHIPGAFLADPWNKDNEDVIDEDFARRLREQAFLIVVYCNGGECEDSLNVAMKLWLTWQIPVELISVYEGGIGEWKGAGLPVTTE